MSYTRLVKMPPANAVNTGKTPCPTSYLTRRYGDVRGVYTTQCQAPTNPEWKKRSVARDIDLPYWLGTTKVRDYKVVGHPLFIEAVEATLARVKRRDPGLRTALGTAGMQCVRLVRGSKRTPSNHSMGLAIDFTIHGILDVRGDGQVQQGLVTLYECAKEEGLFWGVEFGTEDAMHLEASGELVMRWIRAGVF